MLQARLVCHGGGSSAGDVTMGVGAERRGSELFLVYHLQAPDFSHLCIPSLGEVSRQDGLWKHTCFEAFVSGPQGYREYNFSPSRAWAAYDFTAYRAGLHPADVPAPAILVEREDKMLRLSAGVPLPAGADRLGLSAVVEGADGSRTYWALIHPANRPDFHHPDSFTIRIGELP